MRSSLSLVVDTFLSKILPFIVSPPYFFKGTTKNRPCRVHWPRPTPARTRVSIGSSRTNRYFSRCPLGSRYFEARISIPSASLLTLVFLHDTYRGDLPNFPYLTYLDRLYVYAYIVCLLMFIFLCLTPSMAGLIGQC